MQAVQRPDDSRPISLVIPEEILALGLFGVTGGYLMAYPVMAWLVAWLIQRWAKDSYWKRVAAMAAALVPCYLFGTAWFAIYLHRSFASAAMAACLPFIPFDLCKALAAAYISRLVPR